MNSKLRASYGETGSEVGIGVIWLFARLQLFTGQRRIGRAYVIGLRPRGLPSHQSLLVYNQTTNIGINFILFDNKFSGQFDVFQRKRTGLPAGRYDVLLPE